MNSHHSDPMLLGADLGGMMANPLFDDVEEPSLDADIPIPGLDIAQQAVVAGESSLANPAAGSAASDDEAEVTDSNPTGSSDSRLLPARLWPPGLDTMALGDLRGIQHKYAIHPQLYAAAKAAASRAEKNFHAEIMRTAIKHQVRGQQLLTYLADGRRLREPTRYNNFFAYSRAALHIHHDPSVALGDRASLVAKEWNKLDEIEKALWGDREYVAQQTQEAAVWKKTLETDDAGSSKKQRQRQKGASGDGLRESTRHKSSYKLKAWVASIDRQFKAMRFTEGLEAFMVVVPTNPNRRTQMIATPIGHQFFRLQERLSKRSPVDQFADLVTGKVAEAQLVGVTLDDVIQEAPPGKRVRGHVSRDLAHLAGGSLKDIRADVSSCLRELLGDASGRGYVRGWPAKDTDKALRELGLKIVIDSNAENFDASLLRKQGRILNKDEALRLKNALNKKWIRLEPIPGASKGKQKMSESKRKRPRLTRESPSDGGVSTSKRKGKNKSVREEEGDSGSDDEQRPSGGSSDGSESESEPDFDSDVDGASSDE